MNVIGGYMFLVLFMGPMSLEGIWKVKTYGALREIMHQGDLRERVNLSEVAGQSGLYGLGAVANLKGEIIILDGTAYVSQVVDGRATVKKSASKGAALLVTAQVPQWKSTPIPPKVKTLQDLASFVQASAEKVGLNPSGPFPFQVKGLADKVSWHVIDWPEGDRVHSHEKHKNAGARGDLVDKEVTLLGFFSDHHQGQFTHHSTPLHVHVRSEDGAVVGHVDALVLGDAAQLLLPRRPGSKKGL